ncbi:MAG TPA: CDP-glycerol glycerophosphotransferase family protein [Propionibacteriaceae bacterium]|nr:CDP-glycerol glycerophosphotransferase family protein [Propionibacteriaceae bacterium]
MESPNPARTSAGAWSGIAGATRSRVVDLIISNLFNICVVVGAAVMFIAAGSPIFWLGAALAIASLIILGWLMRRDITRGRAMLATYQAQRIVVVLAVAAAYLVRRPDQATWICVATSLGIFAILSEPTVRLLMAKGTPVAVQLPGFPAVPQPPFNPTLVVLAQFAVTAIGGLLALIGVPGWCYVVLMAIGILPMVIMAGHGARAMQISRRSSMGVRKALQQYRPEFAVYYAARNGARYQVGMWLPYFERLNRRFIVITCHPSTVPEITELTSAPIVVPKIQSAHGRLWHLVVDSLKAAFYVQNHQANADMLRFGRLTHIWLNHGDSDKAANYSARHGAFDKIFVSGQQGVDRYAAHGVRIQPEQFAIVGRPQIERIETRDVPPPPDAPRTVLYAPTWHGGKPNTNYSSLMLGPRIVDALLARGVMVIFRPHPHTYRDPQQTGIARDIQRRLSTDRKTTGRQHVFGRAAETDWDIPACFNHCDAMITDVSSVASDFLASGKPFAMVAIQQQGAAFRQAIPTARVAYVIESDLSTLPEALDELLGHDSLAEARRSYRSYCVGEALGAEAPNGFLREVERILDSASPQRSSSSPTSKPKQKTA